MQRRGRQLRPAVGDRAVGPRRRARRSTMNLQRVRELGPDGAVLPRRRPRGAARVGHGRAAGAQPGDAAVPRRARRHGGADRDLPGDQRRAADRARLGRRGVHRHRVRARRARPRGRQPAARPGAHLPADLLGRRRPARARDHRRVLQQRRPLAAAADRRGAARGARRAEQARLPQRPGLPAHRDRRVGGLLRVRGRPDRLRPGHRAADLRIPGRSGEPRAGERRVPAVPRAAHRAAGGRGARRWCAARSRRTSGCRSATTR